MTIRALHHYENIGLLVPEKIHISTGYRYYSARQLETVNLIKILQTVGLSLKSIKEVLEAGDTETLEKQYQIKMRELDKEFEQIKVKQHLLKELKNNIKKGSCLEKYNVQLKTIEARQVISLRKTIASPNDEHLLWEELYGEILKQHVKMPIPNRALAIYHDKEYKETAIDVEVQSDIYGNYSNTETVSFFNTPEFTMASVTFNGDYNQMPEVSQAIATWMEVHNYQIAGPMVNIFHVSPEQESNPDNWVTESGYILKK